MIFDRKALMLLSRRKAETRAFVQWLCIHSGVSPIPPDAMRFLVRYAKFCRWGTTCFDADPRVHAALEGRREAFQQIINEITLTPEQLALIHGARFNIEEDEE